MCASNRKSPASKSESKTKSVVKSLKPASDSESKQNLSKGEATDNKFPGLLKHDSGEYYLSIFRKQRRVSVRKSKEETYVDIGEFYEKDGKFLLSERGISLTEKQWEFLRDASKQIDSCIKTM